MATAAKLTGKDTWKQYPRQMLRARVISEGIRTVYPGVAVGVYTPEEVQDFDTKPMVDVTPGEQEPQSGGRILPYDVDPSKPKTMFKNNVMRKQYQDNMIDAITKSTTVPHLNEIINLELAKLAQLRESGDERDVWLAEHVHNTYKAAFVRLKDPTPAEDLDEDVPDFLKTQMDEEHQRLNGFNY